MAEKSTTRIGVSPHHTITHLAHPTPSHFTSHPLWKAPAQADTLSTSFLTNVLRGKHTSPFPYETVLLSLDLWTQAAQTFSSDTKQHGHDHFFKVRRGREKAFRQPCRSHKSTDRQQSCGVCGPAQLRAEKSRGERGVACGVRRTDAANFNPWQLMRAG